MSEQKKLLEQAEAQDPASELPESEEEWKLKEEYRRFGIETDPEESINEVAELLSTFQETEDNSETDSSNKGKSDLHRTKRLIPILAGAALIGLLLYVFVLAPLLRSAQEETAVPELNTWLKEQVSSGAITQMEYDSLTRDGKVEELGTGNRVMMFTHVQKSEIQSVEVHNDFGTYTFYRNAADDFVIQGAESAPYSKESLASLVVSAGFTLSMSRISENCDTLEEYGLSDSDNPAYYTLTTSRGITHTVYIGKPIPTGAGYYCKYENRPAVYVLDSTLAGTLLSDVRTLMTAVITYPMSTVYYSLCISDLEIQKDGELFLSVDSMSDAEKTQTASNSGWKMLYPEGGYTPSATNMGNLFSSFASLTGSAVLEYQVLGDAEEPTEEQLEVLARYGLSKPYISVTYTYTDPSGGFSVENGVWFSARTENGTYYVYSWLFDLISEVSESDCPWIRYSLIDFIDPPVFSRNIVDIAKISISSGPDDTDYSVNTDFQLVGDGSELVVTDLVSGTIPDTSNFRHLYVTLLSLDIQGYAEDLSAREESLLATLRVETEAGLVTVYRFYTESTRRCFVTIDGEGEFYVMRDSVRKMLSDTKKILNGEDVDYNSRS